MKTFLFCGVFFLLILSACNGGLWTLPPIPPCVDDNGDSTNTVISCPFPSRTSLEGGRIGHQAVYFDPSNDLIEGDLNVGILYTGGQLNPDTIDSELIDANVSLITRHETADANNSLRLSHFSALINNQDATRAYLIGGLTNQYIQDIDFLLPFSLQLSQASNIILQSEGQAWNQLDSMQENRAGHTATRFNNSNSIYIIGGSSNPNIEIFTPGTSSNLGVALIPNRYFHTATALFSGNQILVVGGVATDNDEILSDIQLYNGNDFTPITMLNDFSPRIGHTVNAVEEKRAVIIGGRKVDSLYNDIWVFNLGSKSLQLSDAKLPEPIAYHTTTYLPKEKWLLIVGGETSERVASGNLFLFNPDSEKLIELDSTLVFPRYGHTTTLLPDFEEELQFSEVKLLVIGGRDKDGPVHEIEQVCLNLACTFFE